MSDVIKVLGFTLCASFLVIGLSGCGQQEGPAEKAGRTIDQAAEKAGETVDQAMDKTEEAMDKTGEAVKEGAEKVMGEQ